jgi:Putative prokaryotic signal transducing protein
MIKEDLVMIAKYGDSQEASLARAMLESQGITGLVVGGEINSTLWHLGSTISGVELQVPASEAARANEILESFLDTRQFQAKGEWNCPSCGEEVDAGFEMCWSCGATADEPSLEPANFLPPLYEITERPPDDHEPVIPKEDENPKQPLSADDQARRALKAATYGIMFLPFSFYALYLLLTLSTKELSKPAQKHYYQASFIALFMISFWMMVLGSFL